MLRFKINVIFSIILFNCFFLYCDEQQKLNNEINNEFKLGLENISANLLKKLLTEKNGEKVPIGLITNQTGLDQNGNRNIDILLSKGLNVKAIFASEHAFDGQGLAGQAVNSIIDKKTNLPIISLYNWNFKPPSEQDLKKIDIFIFDIQDSGMRHYTYISMLYKMIELCAENKKKLIVLDRPNPLGYLMEGPLVHKNLYSYISIAPIPLRHAMTFGELAKYFNKYLIKNSADLTVVPMKNYQRTRGLNGKLDIFLSPNIRNINACNNYSFLGILGEISPFSILAGTENAFECLMLPDIKRYSKVKWDELKKLLTNYNINSSIFRCTKDGKKYIGLKIKIKDINTFSNVKTIIAILDFFKKEGIKFYYSKTFNKVIGTYQFRHFIDGTINKEKFYNHINKELKNFFEKAKDLFIYYPIPKIIELK